MERPAYVNELNELLHRGDMEELLRRCQEKVEFMERQAHVAYPEAAYVQEDLGRTYYESDDYFPAAERYARSLEIHREHGQSVSQDAARCIGILGRLALSTGRTAEAELAFHEALTLLDHLPADQQTSRGFVLIDLAQLHTWEKEFEAAEQLLHEAARQHLRNMGYCPDRMAWVFLHLSRVYAEQGRLVAANKAMEKAVHFRLWGGYEDANLASLYAAKGALMARQEKWATAREAYSASISILERVRPHSQRLERVKRRLAKLDESTTPAMPPA